jgi:hypothetical protein
MMAIAEEDDRRMEGERCEREALRLKKRDKEIQKESNEEMKEMNVCGIWYHLCKSSKMEK